MAKRELGKLSEAGIIIISPSLLGEVAMTGAWMCVCGKKEEGKDGMGRN